MLMLAIAPAHARCANEAPDPNGRGRRVLLIKRAFRQFAIRINPHQLQTFAPECIQSALQSLSARAGFGRQPPHLAVVMAKDEGHTRMAQGHEREHLLHVGAFGLLCSEKFTASGEVIKKRADLHFCTNGCAGFLNGNHFAAVDDDLCASFGFSFAAGQSKSAYARNAGYRFAAKTHGAD